MKISRSPDSVARARDLYLSGMTHREISAQFGISQTTVRQWIDDGYYREHKALAARWQIDHPDQVKSILSRHRAGWPAWKREMYNAVQRRRYSDIPGVRENHRRLAKKYRETAQGYISQKIRVIALGHADKGGPLFSDFAAAVTGLSRADFSDRFGGEGEFDHVIPLIAFDLTNPDHLVRAMHPSNIRVIPRRENQRKGGRVAGAPDILSLPWVNCPDALVRAEAFIARCLSTLERHIPSPSEYPDLPPSTDTTPID